MKTDAIQDVSGLHSKLHASTGFTRSCASEDRGTGFEGLDDFHIPPLLRSIASQFSHALISFSDEMKDVGGFDGRAASTAISTHATPPSAPSFCLICSFDLGVKWCEVTARSYLGRALLIFPADDVRPTTSTGCLPSNSPIFGLSDAFEHDIEDFATAVHCETPNPPPESQVFIGQCRPHSNICRFRK
ncbi:hypothetical protein BS47DRAFT_1394612 [Hydnum rufescens UP504]|uniref:Uncharacterized protein n=1 Tax=Hydnum rufescens UP504 TaxID=1448309 RepID=A0A9P6DS94_9AGAM|nr:hypothetical protein BS47DRAFT_1394612 [Hydnum rufescens UP504]